MARGPDYHPHVIGSAGASGPVPTPTPGRRPGPTVAQAAAKRGFDVVVAAAVLLVSAPVIAVSAVAARWDTGASGLFRQQRIGRFGRPFRIYKIRTMRASAAITTTTTVCGDPRVTRLGGVLRRFKIDELPQLLNVLRGEMSLVGPRPDVAGYADLLAGPDRIVLAVRPGITGPASLAYRDEANLLAAVEDPERHNREVIWPDKVRINAEYVRNYRFRDDLRYLWRTLAAGR